MAAEPLPAPSPPKFKLLLITLATSTVNDTEERSEAGKLTPERVLAAAAHLFRIRGYSGTTTREIAAELGVTKATLYHHIGGKEDLLYNMSVASLEGIFTDVSRAIAMETDPLERLVVAIKTHVKRMLTDLDNYAATVTELRSLRGERAKHVQELRRRYDELLRTVLRGAVEQGTIRDDIDLKYLTLGLLNMLRGTLFWFNPAGDLSPEELGDVLADMYLNGTLTDSGLAARSA